MLLCYLAAVACVAFRAGAAEGLEGVLADAAVEAGLRVALVDFVLTVRAGEAGAAVASVAVDFVRARPSVEAGAVGRGETLRARRGRRGRPHSKESLGSPLGAVGDVGFAVDAGVAGPARARVGVDVVGARASVLAGGAQALVDLRGTAQPHEARQAAAVEGVDLIGAGAPVETGIW